MYPFPVRRYWSCEACGTRICTGPRGSISGGQFSDDDEALRGDFDDEDGEDEWMQRLSGEEQLLRPFFLFLLRP